jgi:hypothetical protein
MRTARAAAPGGAVYQSERRIKGRLRTGSDANGHDRAMINSCVSEPAMSKSSPARVSTCRQMVAAILFGAVLLSPVALFVLSGGADRDISQRIAAHSTCSYSENVCSIAIPAKGSSFSIR